MPNNYLVPVVISSVVVLIALWLNRVTPRRVSRFAQRFDLPEDEITTPGIRHYLTRAARWRVGGALVGFLVGSLLPFVVPGLPTDSLVTALVGYLAGAVIGETFAPRLPDATAAPRRRAVMAERRLADYVPARSMRAIWLPPALAAVVLIAGALLPWHRTYATTGTLLRDVAIELVVVVALLVGAAIGQRRVLERPQPATSEVSALQLDDALRAASLQSLAGAGTALGLLVLSKAFFEVGVGTDVQLLRWTFPWAGMFASIAAIGVWAYATTDTRWQQRLDLASREEGVA